MFALHAEHFLRVRDLLIGSIVLILVLLKLDQRTLIGGAVKRKAIGDMLGFI
jgi:hypothetical protein